MSTGQDSNEFETRELRQDEYAAWNTLIERSPQGTIFHTTTWLSSFEGYQFKVITCIYRNNIVGGIPLPYLKRFGVKFAVNPPLTPYLGIAFEESDRKYTNRLAFQKRVSKAIISRLANFAPYFDYSFNYNFTDTQPFIWKGYFVTPRYTYILNLEETTDTLMENMEKDTRNRIVKALKYSLEFTDSSPAEMAKLIHLTYSRKNKEMPYSEETFEKFFKVFFGNKCMVAKVVKHGDELLAGGAFVYDSKRAYYLVGGVNTESVYSGMGPLAIWNLITSAKSKGLKEFDFEGSMGQEIERFFRGFGGNLTPYYSIYKNNITRKTFQYLLRIRSKVRS